MRRRLPTLLPLLLLAILYAGYVLGPLAALLSESLRTGGGWTLERYTALVDPRNSAALEAVANSVGVSVASVFLSAPIGILLALAFTQCEFPGRSALARLALLPVALPPLVGVIAFMLVFGESGMLPRALRVLFGPAAPVPVLDGIPAVVAVHVYSFFVYSYLFVSSALARVDASTLEAATSLGAGPGRTFARVVLPSLRPALAGASLLTFMASMASFTAPLLFAGDRRFMTLQITIAKTNGDLPGAAAMSFALAAVSAVFFLLLRSTGAAETAGVRTKGVARPGRLPLSRAARLGLALFAWLFVALCMAPPAVILLVSFAREGSWTTQLLPAAVTMDHYLRLFTDASAFEPLRNSAVMSVLALAAVLPAGVGAAWMLVKGPLRRWRGALDAALTLPYAVPGTVTAVALILAFTLPSAAAGGTILVGTFWILPLAYAVRTYPLMIRSVSAALSSVDDSLLEAAGSLGAGPWRTFRRVVAPLVAPAVASGAVLVLLASLGEFVSSVLLYTYDSRPASVEIFSRLRAYDLGGAAALSVLLMAAMLVLVAAGSRLDRSGDGRIGPFSG